MDKIELENLLEKYNQGKCTAREKDFVEAWYLQFKDQHAEELDVASSLKELDAVWNDIEATITVQKPQKRRGFLWPQVAAAAAVFILLFGGLLFYFSGQNGRQTGPAVYSYDVQPGKNTATLILSNGKRINLSNLQNGELANESGITIFKTADGQIVYHIKQDEVNAGQTNTLITANGETYQVKLPDGSLVRLNSASSLTYPTSFENLSSRQVELTGEAYFEVSKETLRPFLVESEGQQVKVLGTHFNINTYADEPVTKTTLMEGSVLVSARSGPGRSFLLKPNEQLARRGKAFSILKVNASDEIAWIKGKFSFNEETLESILRKVSRWYDLEIEYKDAEARQEIFGGTMSRFDRVSKVLGKLEATGDVRFEIVKTADKDYKVLVYKK
jgi:transmembrane sensor